MIHIISFILKLKCLVKLSFRNKHLFPQIRTVDYENEHHYILLPFHNSASTVWIPYCGTICLFTNLFSLYFPQCILQKHLQSLYFNSQFLLSATQIASCRKPLTSSKLDSAFRFLQCRLQKCIIYSLYFNPISASVKQIVGCGNAPISYELLLCFCLRNADY